MRSVALHSLTVRLLLLLACTLTTSGCAGLISAYNDTFECPRSEGDHPCGQASKAYMRAMTKPGLPHPPDPGRYAAPGFESDHWIPPVKSVWVAPYVDNAGRRHEPSVIRMIVMPGPSILKPEPEFLVPPVPEAADDGSTIGPPVPPADTMPNTQGRPNPRTRTPQPPRQPRAGSLGGNTGTGLGNAPQMGGNSGFSIPGF